MNERTEKKLCDERIKPFIGKGIDFWLPTDILIARMSAFSIEIQEAVDITTNKVKKESAKNG